MKASYKNLCIFALSMINFIILHADQTSTNNQNPQANPIVIPAARVLPKTTLTSVHNLLDGLPTYIQNLSNQSAVHSADLIKLQTSLSSFAQALNDRHPYITQNSSKANPTIDESAIINDIQVILRSLPWYMQNPKILTISIDLQDFSKQLNNIYNQCKTAIQNTPVPTKPNALNSSDRVQTASLRPEKFSEDQTDILEDSDGTPFPASLETHENNDVITQSLSKKSNQLFHVINKRGKILGSYQRNKTKNGFHIGKFTTIRGKKSCAIEGTMQAPKLHGVHKKAIGIVRNSSYSQEDITLYNYNPAPTKKHSA